MQTHICGHKNAIAIIKSGCPLARVCFFRANPLFNPVHPQLYQKLYVQWLSGCSTQGVEAVGKKMLELRDGAATSVEDKQLY